MDSLRREISFWKTPGSYAIIMFLEKTASVVIGRRGVGHFPPGYYAYTGTACGPGGLAARLGRHLRQRKRHHWHIDYLLPDMVIEEIWATPGTMSHECRWARQLAELPGVFVPFRRFGASDCSCRSHLVLWASPPDWQQIQSSLRIQCVAVAVR